MAKVLITLPDDLLDRVDREARQQRLTRSRFVQDAVRRQLGWAQDDVIEAALERGRQVLASLGRFESTDLIRQERDTRDADDRRR